MHIWRLCCCPLFILNSFPIILLHICLCWCRCAWLRSELTYGSDTGPDPPTLFILLTVCSWGWLISCLPSGDGIVCLHCSGEFHCLPADMPHLQALQEVPTFSLLHTVGACCFVFHVQILHCIHILGGVLCFTHSHISCCWPGPFCLSGACILVYLGAWILPGGLHSLAFLHCWSLPVHLGVSVPHCWNYLLPLLSAMPSATCTTSAFCPFVKYVLICVFLFWRCAYHWLSPTVPVIVLHYRVQVPFVVVAYRCSSVPTYILVVYLWLCWNSWPIVVALRTSPFLLHLWWWTTTAYIHRRTSYRSVTVFIIGTVPMIHSLLFILKWSFWLYHVTGIFWCRHFDYACLPAFYYGVVLYPVLISVLPSVPTVGCCCLILLEWCSGYVLSVDAFLLHTIHTHYGMFCIFFTSLFCASIQWSWYYWIKCNQ